MFSKWFSKYNGKNEEESPHTEKITFIEYEIPDYLIPDTYCTVSLLDDNRKEILGVFEEDRQLLGFKHYSNLQKLTNVEKLIFKTKEHYPCTVIAKYALFKNEGLGIAIAVAFPAPIVCSASDNVLVDFIRICY